MGRLIVTLMLVGPTSSQTLHLIVLRQNGSLCDRIVAIVGPRVAHNGEFCGLIYLFDCVHISLVSALSMMSPKNEIKSKARPPVLAEDKVPPSLGLRPPSGKFSEG